jgi:hypothetical protein
MSRLTTEQQVVLAFFDAHDAGAMRCQGRWAWADDIRNDPNLASRFLKDWADEQRDSDGGLIHTHPGKEMVQS